MTKSTHPIEWTLLCALARASVLYRHKLQRARVRKPPSRACACCVCKMVSNAATSADQFFGVGSNSASARAFARKALTCSRSRTNYRNVRTHWFYLHIYIHRSLVHRRTCHASQDMFVYGYMVNISVVSIHQCYMYGHTYAPCAQTYTSFGRRTTRRTQRRTNALVIISCAPRAMFFFVLLCWWPSASVARHSRRVLSSALYDMENCVQFACMMLPNLVEFIQKVGPKRRCNTNVQREPVIA